MSVNTSEDLLFKISLTPETLKASSTPLESFLYHGNNRPWSPTLPPADVYQFTGLQGLVADYIAAPVSGKPS
jgi:hypothetical protein